jgi:adenylate cyclase
MTIILKKNHGTLDKYIGDAVVGIFGAPINSEEHFIESASASLEMIAKLKELKVYWSENNLYCKDAQDMDVRIGLNTGLAKVGFMGTDALASYTMMGDTVNLAARLEAAGKDYGVNILISEFTNEKIKEKFFTRKLDIVRVKGKNEPVQLFELIAVRGEENVKRRESAKIYEEAFSFYRAQQWDRAIELFKQSEETRGSKDKSAEMLIDRCEYYKSSPPGEGWDGVFTRKHK